MIDDDFDWDKAHGEAKLAHERAMYVLARQPKYLKLAADFIRAADEEAMKVWAAGKAQIEESSTKYMRFDKDWSDPIFSQNNLVPTDEATTAVSEFMKAHLIVTGGISACDSFSLAHVLFHTFEEDEPETLH
jgi:hypothetical protein